MCWMAKLGIRTSQRRDSEKGKKTLNKNVIQSQSWEKHSKRTKESKKKDIEDMSVFSISPGSRWWSCVKHNVVQSQ
jgi:hypothetical protein